MSVALNSAAVIASVAGGIRWLRVAQREHYVPGSVVRFSWRWWTATPWNQAILLAILVGTIGTWWLQPLGWTCLLLVVAPLGLSMKGTTSRLQWTSRLRRLAVLSAFISLSVAAASLITEDPGWTVALSASIPLVVDLSLAIMAPIERALGERWVTRARLKLASSGARVVAITGSYGKTTTKGYVQHLVSSRLTTVSTPGSFNNRMGLARAINEHLTPGTEIFVAEMGTYGKNEIAELCEFVPPDLSVITSIGPVHLERFGSEEAIFDAKSEIIANARVAVLNVDHPSLARLADREEGTRKVIRASGSDVNADVSVIDGILRIAGQTIGSVGPEVFGSNLAIAAAIAAHYGVPNSEIAERLATLPVPPHRRQTSTSQLGFTIIDDTYNSNPAGAAAALELLCSMPGEGRRVVVTPGMVELGARQFQENHAFARAAAARTSDLVVVGLTNRRALVEGARDGAVAVSVLSSRQEAVEWVRSRLGPGDAVLYENDLPDHYP